MNPSQLYTIRGIVRQVCQNVGSLDEQTQEQAYTWINRALIRFSELGQWSWQKFYGESINTVSGQAIVTFQDVFEVTSMYMAAPYQKKLVLIEDRQFRAQYPNDTFTGCPYFYRLAGTSKSVENAIEIGFYPIPDAVYTISYDGVRPIALPTSLSQDIRQYTGMPANIVDIVIDMATAIGYEADDDVDENSRFMRAVARMESAYQKDQSKIDDRLIMSPFDAMDASQLAEPQFPPQYSTWLIFFAFTASSLLA